MGRGAVDPSGCQAHTQTPGHQRTHRLKSPNSRLLSEGPANVDLVPWGRSSEVITGYGRSEADAHAKAF